MVGWRNNISMRIRTMLIPSLLYIQTLHEGQTVLSFWEMLLFALLFDLAEFIVISRVFWLAHQMQLVEKGLWGLKCIFFQEDPIPCYFLSKGCHKGLKIVVWGSILYASSSAWYLLWKKGTIIFVWLLQLERCEWQKKYGTTLYVFTLTKFLSHSPNLLNLHEQ